MFNAVIGFQNDVFHILMKWKEIWIYKVVRLEPSKIYFPLVIHWLRLEPLPGLFYQDPKTLITLLYCLSILHKLNHYFPAQYFKDIKKMIPEADRVAQWVKLQFAMPAVYTEVLVWVPVVLPMQLHVHVTPSGGENGSSTWASVTHAGDQDQIPSSCFQTGPALAIVVIERVNQWMEIFFSSLPMSSPFPAFQPNKQINNK